MAQLAQLTIGKNVSGGGSTVSPSVLVNVTGHRYGSHSWRTSLGLTPVMVEYRLPVADAALVLAEKEVSITITPPGDKAQPTTWQRIVVVGEGPSDDPEVRTVILSDVRWYLLRVHLVASYNRRLYSGTGYLTSPVGQPLMGQTTPLTNRIIYQLPTLKNDGTPTPIAWKAFEMVRDVLAQLNTLVQNSGVHAGIGWKDLSNLQTRGTWNPSDVVLDDAGNVALGQALGTVGGVDIRVGQDGSLEVVSSLLGDEKSIIQAACTSSLASGAGVGATPKGVMRFCAMNHIAPTALDVLFTREMEIRTDSFERSTDASFPFAVLGLATNPGQYVSDAPWCEPVMRVADLALNIRTTNPLVTGGSYVAVQSTYVSVDDWFTGVAALADFSTTASGKPISRLIVQQSYLGDVLKKAYCDSPTDPLGPSVIWSSRIGVIMSDYRNVFRLNPRFASRCVPGTIIANRAGLINPATGERAPSSVYRDFFVKPTSRSQANQERNGNEIVCVPESQSLLIGIGQSFKAGGRTYGDPSFPTQLFNIQAAQKAPFIITVEDPVNGIFRLEPKLLPGAEVSQVIPGLVAVLPTVDAYQLRIMGDTGPGGPAIPWFEYCNLIGTDRVAIIFSAVPVGPHGGAATKIYEVSYTAALARLGAPSQAVTAQGPKVSIRIGPGVQTARYAWSDQFSANILGAFMIGQGDPDMNIIPVNDSALSDYATASAAVYMATQLDHYEGTQEIAFSPTIAPIGSLTTVEHFVTATGEIYTDLHATHVTPLLRPESFMSQSSRNVIWGNIGNSAST